MDWRQAVEGLFSGVHVQVLLLLSRLGRWDYLGMASLLLNYYLIRWHLGEPFHTAVAVMPSDSGSPSFACRLDDDIPPLVPRYETIGSQSANLTHVIVAYEREGDVLDMAGRWRQHPPCTKEAGAMIKPVLVLQGRASEDIEDALLPFQQCFKGIQWASRATADALFEWMWGRGEYGLWLEPDAAPIQSDWLSALFAGFVVQPENEPFWIKGAIFRGNLSAMPPATPLPELIAIGRVGAVYDFGSAAFRHFYSLQERRHARLLRSTAGPKATERKPSARAADFSLRMARFLASPFTIPYTRHIAHKFQFTEAVMDLRGIPGQLDVEALARVSSRTLLVRTGPIHE